jgi:hypothetical protein
VYEYGGDEGGEVASLWMCTKYGGDGEGEAVSSHAREDLSDALHSAHHRPTFCEHRESGRASLRNRRSQSYTCMGVRAIRFSGSILATLASSARPSSSSSAPFKGLYCLHLSASTVYDYIEHTYEMSRVNGATNALSISPSVGYITFLVIVHVLLLFTAYVSIHTHMHMHVVTYITLIFWIKLKHIMSNSLTLLSSKTLL